VLERAAREGWSASQLQMAIGQHLPADSAHWTALKNGTVADIKSESPAGLRRNSQW
jgi:hypothetical protein